jgi:hypothetical protein
MELAGMTAIDFAASVARTVRDGRELAESRMDSTCRIFYVSGPGTLNTTTNVQTPAYTNRATGVPCRVHPPTSGTADAGTPGAALSVRDERVWSIPVSATAPRAGDYVELTTAGALTDAALLGKTFRIVDIGDASQATARRMRVQVEP